MKLERALLFMELMLDTSPPFPSRRVQSHVLSPILEGDVSVLPASQLSVKVCPCLYEVAYLNEARAAKRSEKLPTKRCNAA